jgi:hypothetical protein
MPGGRQTGGAGMGWAATDSDGPLLAAEAAEARALAWLEVHAAVRELDGDVRWRRSH